RPGPAPRGPAGPLCYHPRSPNTRLSWRDQAAGDTPTPSAASATTRPTSPPAARASSPGQALGDTGAGSSTRSRRPGTSRAGTCPGRKGQGGTPSLRAPCARGRTRPPGGQVDGRTETEHVPHSSRAGASEAGTEKYADNPRQQIPSIASPRGNG